VKLIQTDTKLITKAINARQPLGGSLLCLAALLAYAAHHQGGINIYAIVLFLLGLLACLTTLKRTICIVKNGTSISYNSRIIGGRKLVQTFDRAQVKSIVLAKRIRSADIIAIPFLPNRLQSIVSLGMNDNSAIVIALTYSSPKKAPLDIQAHQIADFIGVPLLDASIQNQSELANHRPTQRV
jgi:hypothetical protein